MSSRVFVARVPDEPYMEISSGGSFINPIMSAFSLRDTKLTKTQTDKLYIVVLDRVVSYVKLSVIGHIPGVNIQVAWNNLDEQFSSSIEREVSINAINDKASLPFWVKTSVIDSLDTITMDQYRNILKLRIVYA